MIKASASILPLLLLIALQILSLLNAQTTSIYSACPAGNSKVPLSSLQLDAFCTQAFHTESSLNSTNPTVCVPANETAAHMEAQSAYDTEFAPNLKTFWDQTPTCGPKAKVFICLHYFPRVDADGNVLKICKSTCDNYFKTCGSAYQTDFKCVNTSRFEGSWNEGKGTCTGSAFSAHQGVWKMLAFSSAGLLLFFAVNLLL